MHKIIVKCVHASMQTHTDTQVDICFHCLIYMMVVV